MSARASAPVWALGKEALPIRGLPLVGGNVGS
jgi:hypothetical protein